MGLKKDADSQEANVDYVTLDLHTGDISTNLDEKRFMDLKERVDACKDRAAKLKEIQYSLDMNGEKSDTMSVEGEVGTQEMEDWMRMMEPDDDREKKKMFEDTKRRLGEAKKIFSVSMDKLSEELVALNARNYNLISLNL